MKFGNYLIEQIRPTLVNQPISEHVSSDFASSLSCRTSHLAVHDVYSNEPSSIAHR